MYHYKFTRQVVKFLEKQDKHFLGIFFNKMEILSKDPYQNSLDIKPLRWYDNTYRLRIWKYRFLYKLEDTELIIYVYKSGSRGDIYK
jgi:mRNA interferase RelE/StbE